MRGAIAAWVFDNVPLPGFFQPYLFGLIIGRWPVKAKGDTEVSPRGSYLECGEEKVQNIGGHVND